MKKTFLILAAFGAVALAALADLPSYVTKSAYGNNTAGAQVIFPSSPNLGIRLVNVNWNSDSNAAVLNMSTGAGAYAVTATNSSSTAVTNQINSTNGLTASSTLVLEHAGVAYAATLSSFSSNSTLGAFVVTASGGFGVASSVNDSVYQMGTASSIPIGATTNAQNGEAIYVGSVGRPVLVQLTPAAATNKLNSVVARYE